MAVHAGAGFHGGHAQGGGSPRPSSGSRSGTGGPSSSADPYRPSAWTLLDRRHRAEPRRPRRPHASGVRVHPPDRHLLDALDPRRPPRCASCTSAAGRGRWPATSPASRPARRSGSWSSTARWSSWCGGRLPADGMGLDVQVVDARAGLAAEPPAGRRRAARRVRRRPHPRAPDLGGVRGGRRRVLAPGGCYAANLADGGRARLAPRRASPGGPRRPRRRCSPTSRSSRHRTCCTAAGSATSCWSPAAGTGRTCRWTRWPGGWRPTRSRHGC